MLVELGPARSSHRKLYLLLQQWTFQSNKIVVKATFADRLDAGLIPARSTKCTFKQCSFDGPDLISTVWIENEALLVKRHDVNHENKLSANDSNYRLAA